MCNYGSYGASLSNWVLRNVTQLCLVSVGHKAYNSSVKQEPGAELSARGNGHVHLPHQVAAKEVDWLPIMLLAKLPMGRKQILFPLLSAAACVGQCAHKIDWFLGPIGDTTSSVFMEAISKLNEKKKVTRALEAPDKINIFSSSMSWIFQPSQCLVNIAICKMAMKCHEDGRRNTLSIVFAGDSARHHFQNFFSDKICFGPHFCCSVAKLLGSAREDAAA